MKRGAATNQFSKGLVMDFNPLITPDNVLTDALNATLITNNGNENVLQNDMGNCIVETAFLPEGYIPVGTCEFGDIIYVASYNPFINKCQLGCFPSPQRNILSNQISDLKQSINPNDFQEIGSNGKPTGQLKNVILKKIIYENNLSSGDKFIVNAQNINYEKYLTDVGNTDHVKDDFPKLYKIKLVSIEENGKIVELTNGLKWYENGEVKGEGSESTPGDFFLLAKKLTSPDEKIEPAVWRSAVSSAYCIFTSKVSGKLALLIELEQITGFSLTWGVDITESENNNKSKIVDLGPSNPTNYVYKDYNIYWLLNWETDNNNINPSGVLLYDGYWNSLQVYSRNIFAPGTPYAWIHNTHRNYEHTPISRVYSPEECISYKDFIENKEYDRNVEKLIRTALVNAHTDDAAKQYYKKCALISAVRDPKVPGNYYINAGFVINDTYHISTVNNRKENPGKPQISKFRINSIPLSDDIINNTFKRSVKKDFYTFKIPTAKIIDGKPVDILNLGSSWVYNYKVAPYMPYGFLEQFIVEGEIDFNKIGKKYIDLTTWKYFNDSSKSTLTLGLEAYTEPNHAISKVTLEFYDINGKCAAWHLPYKESYNGIITKPIIFGENSTYEFSDKDHEDNDILHPGIPINIEEMPDDTYIIPYETPVNGGTGQFLYKEDKKEFYTKKTFKERDGYTYQYFKPDGGSIYANSLYAVKICIDYSQVGPLGEYLNTETKYFYRWYWTTKQFNEYYTQTNDFNNIQFTLNFAGDLKYKGRVDGDNSWSDSYQLDTSRQIGTAFNSLISSTNPESLSAIGQLIKPKSSTGNGNLQVAVLAGLSDNYNIFNINADKQSEYIERILAIGNQYIIKSPEQPAVKFSDKQTVIYSGIYPNDEVVPSDKPMPKLPEAPKIPDNKYKLYFTTGSKQSSGELIYINPDYQEITVKEYTYIEGFDLGSYGNEGLENDSYQIDMNFDCQHYSKYYFLNQESYTDGKVMRSFITKPADYLKYSIDNKGRYFTGIVTLGLTNGSKSTSTQAEYGIVNVSINYDENNNPSSSYDAQIRGDLETWGSWRADGDKPINVMTAYPKADSDIQKSIKDRFPLIFPYTYMHSKRGGNQYDYAYYIHPSHTGDNAISKNSNFDTWDLKDNISFVGCVGATVNENSITLGDPKESEKLFSDKQVPDIRSYKTAPVKYGQMTATLLKKCYYFPAKTQQLKHYTINNYVYLDTNITRFQSDLVLRLSLKDNIKKCNDLILVYGGKSFGNFRDEILNKIFDGDTKQPDYKLLIDSPNVNLKMGSYQGTFPIALDFQYIPPQFNYLSESEIVVEALPEQEKEASIALGLGTKFNYDSIYYLLGKDEQTTDEKGNVITGPMFKELSSGIEMRSENWIFHVSENFVSNLSISDDTLVLTRQLQSTGTYQVVSYNNIPLTNFPKQVTIFEGIKYNPK